VVKYSLISREPVIKIYTTFLQNKKVLKKTQEKQIIKKRPYVIYKQTKKTLLSGPLGF